MVPPNARGREQIEKMKHFKLVLESFMTVLSIGKHANLEIGLKYILPLYDKEILSILRNHEKVPQQQPQAGVPSDQPQFPPLQQSLPGRHSQQRPQQQQLQQMHNYPNQLQQQSNMGAMARSNSLSMANTMQLGIQNTVQSDQLLTNGTGLGHLAAAKSKTCKICGNCVHKRRNPIE